MGEAPPEKPIEHPRGSFVYPEPFEAVALDTSYYTLFGVTFYLITVFELTRIFLRESTEAVVAVLEEFLARYPGVGVVVIDRCLLRTPSAAKGRPLAVMSPRGRRSGAIVPVRST